MNSPVQQLHEKTTDDVSTNLSSLSSAHMNDH